MSNGDKYWRVALGPHPSVPQHNYVTTRNRGDIPNCAPAVDVFIEREISQVQWFNNNQVPVYAKAIRDDGPWPQTLEPIKNRAPKSKGSYYSS